MILNNHTDAKQLFKRQEPRNIVLMSVKSWSDINSKVDFMAQNIIKIIL